MRLMLCGQDDDDCNRLCSARRSELAPCDGSAGFDDRELFELLLEPSHRSPLYRSSHLAARFALGLATGQEWSHFYYLNGGAEIARVEAPDWLASDPEPLALSHAMLVKQCQLGLDLSRGRLRGPRAGRHLRPRSCRVPPHDPHAPGTARPACSGVRQGHIQAPVLGPNTSSRQADHPRGGQVSDPAVSRTGGRDAGGNCSRMPGRSPIKRAKLRWRVGAWLMLDINSAIPWREPECRLAARSATLPVLRAALIAGNESGRGSVAHRADHVTLPSMIQRNQRNHFTPPILTGLAPLGSQRVRCPSHPSVHNTYYAIRQ